MSSNHVLSKTSYIACPDSKLVNGPFLKFYIVPFIYSFIISWNETLKLFLKLIFTFSIKHETLLKCSFETQA